MNKITIDIVNIVADKYKQKSYKELQSLINYKNPKNYFYKEYNDKKYWFEIEAQYFNGKKWNLKAHQSASEILAGEVSLRTSKHRATKEYRHKILPVLLDQVMNKAVERAKL